MLTSPVRGKPLILYTSAATNSFGALLAQVNEAGKETALYYRSQTLMGAECNYSPIEKECLTLIFTVQKLRHYCLSHDITLISRADPIKFLMTRPMLSGRFAKWMLLLSEYTISYRPVKAVKGQAVVDFLAAHPMVESEEINDDFPDEQVMLVESQSPWQMYFDGAARTSGVGAGVIFITPRGDLLPYSFTLGTTCTNNEAEYRSLIIGMEIAQQMEIKLLHIFGDSKLIIIN